MLVHTVLSLRIVGQPGFVHGSEMLEISACKMPYRKKTCEQFESLLGTFSSSSALNTLIPGPPPRSSALASAGYPTPYFPNARTFDVDSTYVSGATGTL